MAVENLQKPGGQPPKELNHEEDSLDHCEHLHSVAAAPSPAGKFSAINSKLATQYFLRDRRTGDVQGRGIYVHPGSHLTGRLGASQYTRGVATRQRQSGTDPDSYTHSRSHTYSHTSTRWRRRWWWLRASVESKYRVQHSRNPGDPQWHQLHQQLVDDG